MHSQIVTTMLVDPLSGILLGATQVLSPHQDARPPECTIDLVVVHGISVPPGQFGGPWIDQLFSGNLSAAAQARLGVQGSGRVSAHTLIRRDGVIHQYVPFGARAWHAGRSSYGERTACNDFSIGIELEGTDELPYEDVQYSILAALIRALCVAYPTLQAQRVVGHSDIAPGRKSDPGPAFDWGRLRALLAG
jgi:AmpD protein